MEEKKGKVIKARVSDDLYKKVEFSALSSEENLSEYLRKLIEKDLQNLNGKESVRLPERDRLITDIKVSIIQLEACINELHIKNSCKEVLEERIEALWQLLN